MARAGKSRKRSTRMDAAIDAMKQIGFEAANVRRTVKKLLKVYGGDEHWPFIEAYAYKELLEALLRDKEDVAEDENLIENDVMEEDGNFLEDNAADDANPTEENVADGGELLKNKAIMVEEYAGTSDQLLENQQDETPPEGGNETPSPAATIGVPTPTQYPPTYEWIASDEEDPEELDDEANARISNEVPEEQNDGTPKKNTSSDVDMLSCEAPETLIFSQNGGRDIPSIPFKKCGVPSYGWIESDEEDPDDFVELSHMHGRLSSVPW